MTDVMRIFFKIVLTKFIKKFKRFILNILFWNFFTKFGKVLSEMDYFWWINDNYVEMIKLLWLNDYYVTTV